MTFTMLRVQLSLIFFLLYCAAVLIIGWIASRRETEEGFMIADRKVAGMQLAATMSAGYFDGATLAIYLAYVYKFGLSAIWMFAGMALGFTMLRFFAHRIKQKADELKVYAMPEYFLHVIGKRSGICYSAVLIVVFFLLLIVNLIVSGKILSVIFPLSYAISVAIGGGIILTYLLLAGFNAVIRTDVFQLLIAIVMSMTVAAYLLGKTDIPQTELRLLNMGGWDTLGFLLIGSFGIMVQPDLWQRLFASRNTQTMKRGLAFSACILPLLAIIIGIVGLATKQFFPEIAPEDALVTGFSRLLPFGMREFGMVLLYAVCLSSSDTVTFVVSSIFTRDLQNYTRKFSTFSMRRMTRLCMVLFVLLAVTIGVAYQDITALGFSLASLSLALFPPTFGSLFFKLSDRAVAWSIGIAAFSVLLLFLTGTLTPATSAVSLPVSLGALLVLQVPDWVNRRAIRASLPPQ